MHTAAIDLQPLCLNWPMCLSIHTMAFSVRKWMHRWSILVMSTLVLCLLIYAHPPPTCGQMFVTSMYPYQYLISCKLEVLKGDEYALRLSTLCFLWPRNYIWQPYFVVYYINITAFIIFCQWKLQLPEGISEHNYCVQVKDSSVTLLGWHLYSFPDKFAYWWYVNHLLCITDIFTWTWKLCSLLPLYGIACNPCDHYCSWEIFVLIIFCFILFNFHCWAYQQKLNKSIRLNALLCSFSFLELLQLQHADWHIYLPITRSGGR